MQVFKGKVFSLLFLHLFLMVKSDSYFMPSGPRLHGSGHFIHINICCREEQEVSTDPTALLSLMNRLEINGTEASSCSILGKVKHRQMQRLTSEIVVSG